jgi:hypothetical protein
MRQAIITKWLGPTDHKDARIRATCQAGSVTRDWDSNHDITANHRAAARKLLGKLGWTDATYHGGVLPNGDYAFVEGSDDSLDAVSWSAP